MDLYSAIYHFLNSVVFLVYIYLSLCTCGGLSSCRLFHFFFEKNLVQKINGNIHSCGMFRWSLILDLNHAFTHSNEEIIVGLAVGLNKETMSSTAYLL